MKIFILMKKNSTDYVIIMKNGDNTDGQIKLKDYTLTSVDGNIQDYKVYKTLEHAYPKMSKDDHIVRLVKQSWIYAKHVLKYPASARFNDNDCDIMIMDDGSLCISYRVFCKNGFGAESELTVHIKYEKSSNEMEYDISAY